MPDSQETREKHPKRAEPPRQPEPGEVLRARPVKGKIDWAELTREHIARYPKILAALAEHERGCRSRRDRE